MKSSEIEKIFDSLVKYNSKYDANISSLFPSIKQWPGKLFYTFVIFPAALSIIFIIPAIYSGSSSLWKLSPLLSVALSYIGIVVCQVSLIFEQRKDLMDLARNASSVTLGAVRNECLKDLEVVESLLQYEKSSVDYVYKHLVVERQAFERRVGVLVGALEKIGIIPGIFTLLFAFWSKINLSPAPYIVEGAAIGVLFLYVMAFNFHFHFNRLDRYIGLFEYVIEREGG